VDHNPVQTYSTNDFACIAAAIGIKIDDVVRYRNDFEAIAAWYRSDLRSPRRTPPSTIKRRVRQIAAASKRLLQHLEIYDYRNAADEPRDWALLEALTSVEDGTEDDVLLAAERVARLAEIFDGIDAVQFLQRQADRATLDITRFSRLMPDGHRGDSAENECIVALMSLYEKITGRKAGTSTVGPTRPKRGKASGPLIRFLEAAGAPLGIEYTPGSWRGRIRDSKTGGRQRKK
jgi:hypothetical protein